MKIGVFDSGIGGLSILKSFLKILPQYDYVYLADNAHLPYGDKSVKEIYDLTIKAVDFLFKKDCQLIILACNTATASALHKIQTEYLPKFHPGKKVLGVIRPAVEATLAKKPQIIGIMATAATVRSHSFIKEFRKFNDKVSIYQQSCPLLVPLIEKGPLAKGEWSILKDYLQPLLRKKIDILLVGCTHYNFILDKIKAYLPPHLPVVAEDVITAQSLKTYLEKHPEIDQKLTKTAQRQYYLTGDNKNYRQLFDILLLS